jgi:hypothetical protein
VLSSPANQSTDITVAELLAQYLQWGTTYYHEEWQKDN